MISRRLSPCLGLVVALGLAHGAQAFAAETVTVTPPSDAIAGIPFSLGVATTSDSSSSSSLRVFIRPDDGRPCEASAAAVNGSAPKPLELYDDRRHADPVTINVPAQTTAGGLRVCAFVELIPAPQTTLSRQDLVVGVRAPRATLQLSLSTTSPFVGGSFQARAQGSTEAPDGGVVTRAQRGPCGQPTADDLASTGVAPGSVDLRQDVTIAAAARVLPDRVCAWLTTTALGGAVLATAEQPIAPRYDGSLSVIQKRFVAVRGKHRKIIGWAFEIKGRGSGNVKQMYARIVRGGSCVAGKAFHKGAIFDLQCLLKRPPRRPFVVNVTYVTALNVRRSVGNLTVAVPKAATRHRL